MLSQVPWNSTDTLELRRSKTAALHQHVTLPHKLPPTGEAMWSWQLFHYCQLPLLQFFYYIHALSFLNARWMLTIRFFFFSGPVGFLSNASAAPRTMDDPALKCRGRGKDPSATHEWEHYTHSVSAPRVRIKQQQQSPSFESIPNIT